MSLSEAARLSERRPKGQDGVTLDRVKREGRWVLRKSGGTGLAELDGREYQLWTLLDGTRTLKQLVLRCMTWPQPGNPEWVARTLTKLSAAGLLEDDWGTARPEGQLFARLGGPIEISTSLADLLRIAGGVGAGLLAAAGGILAAGAIGLRGLSLMPEGANPWGVLLALYCTATLVQAARLAGVIAAEGGVRAYGLKRFMGLPWLGFEPLGEDVGGQRLAALWGLAAQLAAAGVCSLGALGWGWTLFDQALAVVIALFVIDIGPLFTGDGLALLVHWTQDRHVRERTISFLSRRLTVRIVSGDPWLPQERRLLMVGFWMAAWAILAVRFGARLFRESLPGFEAMMAGDMAQATKLMGAALLIGAVIGLSRALIGLLLAPIRWAAAAGFRGERSARAMLPISMVAAGVALLLPASLISVAYFLMMGTLMPLVLRQACNIPGSRLGLGYYALLMGLCLHVVLEGPRVLELAGALRWELLPPDLTAWAAAFIPVCFGGFGFAALLEAGRIRFRPFDWLLGIGLWGTIVAAGRASLDTPDLLVLAAHALIPSGAGMLLLQRRDTPMRHYWRPFILGAICLAMSCWIPSRPGEALRVPPAVFTASLILFSGAFSAANAMFAVPMPLCRRPEGHRAGATPIEGLWDGGAHVLTTVLELTRFFLGDERAARMVERFNTRMSVDPVFPVRFENWSLVVSRVELPGPEQLGGALERGLAILEGEVVGSAGHRFFERALSAAAEGLYWLEWDAVHVHVLKAGTAASSRARLIEEVNRAPLFRSLSQPELDELVRALRCERFSAGADVARQGEKGDRFYIVSRGELDVVQEDVLGYPRHLARLQPGDCFGEVALLGSGVRSATVQARTDIELISLGKEEFERFLPQREGVTQLIRHGGFLSRLPLFSGLPSALVSRLAGALEQRDYAAGIPVLESGQTTKRLLMVKEGRLEGPGGPLGPGDTLGQECLVDQQDWSATITATVPSVVLWLPREAILKTLELWLSGFRSLDELAGRGADGGWDTLG